MSRRTKKKTPSVDKPFFSSIPSLVLDRPFIVMGLDLSLTGTAICFLNSGGDIISVKTFTVQCRGLERVLEIEKFLMQQIEAVEPDLVYLEGFSYASRGRSVIDIGMLGGVIRRRFVVDGVSYVEVPPMSLKKFVCGKGNANKNVVLEQAFRRYGIGSETLTDDNMVDAYCLAQFGLAHTGHKSATKAQQAVLDRVERWDVDA